MISTTKSMISVHKQVRFDGTAIIGVGSDASGRAWIVAEKKVWQPIVDVITHQVLDLISGQVYIDINSM